MIKFRKIEQFRDAVKSVTNSAYYKNAKRDENGEIIPGQPVTWRLPELEFTGTVKLHGTNSSWVYDFNTETLVCQSRNRVLTVGDDNAGFALWTESFKDKLIEAIKEEYDGITVDKLVVYGEWCGPGIQKGVALSQLDRKIFVIFESVLIFGDGEDETRVYNTDNNVFTFERDDVHTIYEFPTYRIKIDFNHPALAQNEMIAITEAVEAECPVGKALGVSGVGEGVVWSYRGNPNSSGIMFKVKGEKHSISKVKTLASVDVEAYQNVIDFVNGVVTENRCNQGIDYLNEMNIEVNVKATPDFLRWIVNDVLTEEATTIVENNLDGKTINREVAKKAREWFFAKLQDF